MAHILGIDLGTTNSVVAVIEAGEPTVIPNAEGANLTPSVVAVSKSGERLVGQVAKRQAITNPENTIFSIKRFMGRKFSDPEVQRDIKLVPYRVSEAANGDIQVWLGGKSYSPQEVSAMILQKLKTDAEQYLGEKITQAVITVPAYFNDAQRQATKDSGQIAGLEVMRIVNEPTASALAYGLDKTTEEEEIAVYDLGGGTYDISVLTLAEGVFKVNATNGDTHLGGDDFDQRVIEWVADEFKRDQGIDLRQDRMALQRLKEASEKAKIELSTTQSTEINLPFISADAQGPKHLSMTLTRSKLEQLVGDLIDKTIPPMRSALKDADMKESAINEVLLVGGQTRMPAVQQKVQSYFGKEPHKGINPDEVVAVGAAIQAGVLKGDVKSVLLLDVTPLTLGVETLGGVANPMIPRNTTIPTSKVQTYSTASDNQPSVEIHIVQGERPMASENKTLGKFILDGLPPAPRGVPQIEVKFDIDANGIVNVSAKDVATGKAQNYTITGASGLNKDEIDRMVRESEAHADEDRKRRELIEARNLADSLAYNAEKSLRDLGEQVPAEVKSEVEGKVQAVREALNGDDTDRIKAATEELNQAMQKIGQAMYAQQQANAGTRGPGVDGMGGMDGMGGDGASPNGSGPGAGREAEEGTVEGEFREV